MKGSPRTKRYGTARELAEILGCNRQSAAKVARHSGIPVRRLPGLRSIYYDLQRGREVAEASTIHPEAVGV